MPEILIKRPRGKRPVLYDVLPDNAMQILEQHEAEHNAIITVNGDSPEETKWLTAFATLFNNAFTALHPLIFPMGNVEIYDEWDIDARAIAIDLYTRYQGNFGFVQLKAVFNQVIGYWLGYKDEIKYKNRSEFIQFLLDAWETRNPA